MPADQSLAQQAMLIGFIFKILALLIGGLSIYLGYRLFIKGYFGEAGNLTSKIGNNKLTLKKAAPGTFFAVAGTVIICITMYKGAPMSYKPSATGDNRAEFEMKADAVDNPADTMMVPESDRTVPKEK